MLDKHGKEGLVVLGVTLDDPKDAKTRQLTIDYLQKKKITFQNYNLDGDPEKRPATLDFGGAVPGAFVFDRTNRYVRKLPRVDAKGEPIEDFDYDKIDKAILEALKGK
jgi:hypothetical protein